MLIPKRVFTSEQFEYIVWRDHTSQDAMDWTTITESQPLFYPPRHWTVGFVLEETPKELTVCMTMGEIDPNPMEQSFFGWFTILKGDIVERRTIRLDAHGICIQGDPVAADDTG